VEGYHQVADRLLAISNGTFMSTVAGSFEKFPAFVFRVLAEDRGAQDLAVWAGVAANFFNSDRLFFDFEGGVKGGEAVAYLDKDFFVKMTDNFTFGNLVKFMRENSHPLLGDWSFQSIRQVSRLFAVVCAMSEQEIEEYRGIAQKYYPSFGWGSTVVNGERVLDVFKLKSRDFPAIVVVDIHGERFFKTTRATNLVEVEVWLAKFGESKELPPYEALEVQSADRQLAEMVRLAGLIFVVVVATMIGIALIGAGLYICWRRRSPPKHD
jgi:hypothetical protein